MFLRTSVKENNITLSDLYVGNSINICGRLLNIVDYGDDYTRRKLSAKKERFVPEGRLLWPGVSNCVPSTSESDFSCPWKCVIKHKPVK